MESFQGRAPATGWNDLPSTLSPNLRFGGGSKKRLNRNNLYQQYNNSSNSVYSYSSSSSQEYGLNQMMNSQPSINGQYPMQNGISTPTPPMMSASTPSPSMMNSQTPPPMMMNSHTPPPMMMKSQTPPPPMMMNSQNPQPQMMNSQVATPPMMNSITPPPASLINNQTVTPSVNYYNNTTNPSIQQTNQINAYQTQSYGSENNQNNFKNSISPDTINNIIFIFRKYLDNYKSSCSLFQRKMFEDTNARINTMIEQINGNMLDEQTIKYLETIANALESRDNITANSTVSILLKNNSQERKWTLGVKSLIDYFFN